MSGSRDTQKLVAFIVAVIVIAGAAFGVIMLMQPSVQPGGPEVGIVTPSETKTITLNEIKAMDTLQGYTSFQNSYGNVRGQGNYSGVKVADLLELAGGMESDQILKVNATDGYTVTFPYCKVYPNESVQEIQGDMILAYEYNETEVPEWEDGYRIVFLTEDGYYSNEDANQTTPAEYFGGAAGPSCVRNVDTLTVENIEPTALTVEGDGETTEFSMNELKELDSVTGLGGYKKSSGTIEGPFNYTAVPIETILQSAFETLPVNYTVEAVASDQYTTYYNKTQVETGLFNGYNPDTGDDIGPIVCNLSLAYYEDGEPLTHGGALRAVTINEDGNLTDGHFWNKDVVKLTLVDQVEDWQIELAGVDPLNMTHDDYYAGASCSQHRTEIEMNGNMYKGLPLYVLVAAMDGGDDTHYTFNSSLAIATNYNVTLYNSEGHNVTLNAGQIADNTSIVVAGWVNGKLIDPEGNDWPIKLVTPNGTAVLGNIVKIEMSGWQE